MTHRLGLHWIRQHQEGWEFDHIRRMGYWSIKLFEHMWSNRDFCNELLDAARPECVFVARDHPLSEQHGDMERDPAGTGRRHAEEWRQKIDSGRYHLPVSRSVFLGINEPADGSGDMPIAESDAQRERLRTYSLHLAQRGTELGLHMGIFNFATGKPRTHDNTAGGRPDWDFYEIVHQAMVRGGHWLIDHIYGTAAVPLAPGHYDRLQYCKWRDVQTIMGEFGADEHVIGGGPHDGWLVSMQGDPHVLADWTDTLIGGVLRLPGPEIHSWQGFTFDFSAPWWSFNLQRAAEAFEQYAWTHGEIVRPGSGTTQPPILIPVVTTPGPTPPAEQPIATGTVHAENGLNIRSGPGIDFAKVGALTLGAVVNIYEVKRIATLDWLRIGPGLWVSSIWVKVGEPEPEPPPAGDKWARTMAFVERWEGGYQNIANDKGNWTGCEVGVGINKGTKYGISACSYPDLDIINLTPDQARAIYRRDYWQASGADPLEWPLCLLVMDTAVLHGVGAAKAWLNEVGPNPYLFVAKRLRVYLKADNWDFWGKAWIQRVIELLETVGV